LIQKIFEVDPLTGPRGQGVMRMVSIIENQGPVGGLKVERVIDKILGHLGLCKKNQRPPPKPKALELQIDYSDFQLPSYEEVLPIAFGPIFSLDPVFFLFYTHPIKKESLIK
jgi:hypothetical protein